MTEHASTTRHYTKDSLGITGAVSLGTGMMIGAGIFALLGEINSLAGNAMPYIFLLGGLATLCSSYSYSVLAREYPSSGGVVMFIDKTLHVPFLTGLGGLFMIISMILNESLVARTFGHYALTLLSSSPQPWLVSVLGVGLLVVALVFNLIRTSAMGRFSIAIAVVKVVGLSAFAVAALWVAPTITIATTASGVTLGSGIHYIAAIAFTVLAFKGFTTITTSGEELTHARKNIPIAITSSILICIALYVFVSLAVQSSLSATQIADAQNFALAEAARPIFKQYGVLFMVILAMIATVSAAITSIYAVSRMLTMLTDMKLIPHSHFGMPGSVQKHTVVYTVVIASTLTVLFDVSRIAVLGAILYLLLELLIHYSVLRLRSPDRYIHKWIVVLAMVFDSLILAALLYQRVADDMFIVVTGIAIVVLSFLFQLLYLRFQP